MNKQPFRSLLPLLSKLARSPKLLVVAAIIMLFEKSANVLIAVSLKEIIDALNSISADFKLAVLLVVGYGVLRASAPIFAEIRDMLFTRASENSARDISRDLSEHILGLGEAFHSVRSPGAIARDIDRGTNGVSFALRYLIFSGIPTLFEIAIILIVMTFLLSPIYSFLALIGICIYFMTSYKGNEWRSQYIKKVNQYNSKAGANLTECILNHQTINFFNLAPWSIKRIDDTLKEWVSARVSDRRSLAIVTSLQAIVIAITLTALLLIGTSDVMQKDMSTGEFVMLTVFTAQLFAPLNLLGFVYKEMRQSLADVGQMFSYLGEVPHVERKIGAAKPTFPFRSVEIFNVQFQYPGSNSLLKDLTMSFSAGQHIAIVGPSGSGKSTIAKLLVRAYDPLDGAVLLDGKDFRQLDLTALRNGIGIVTQDTSLFSMTLAENIALGLPGASKQQVANAAKQAGLTDLVSSLPLGIDTPVGERGGLLSGGERQRIGLARALIKHPWLLILDEATASLDNVSEAGILRALRENVTNSTTRVTIAHRLSTVVDADIIYVMANGTVVESGKHNQLLSLKGLYYSLWSSQTQVHRRSPQSPATTDPES
ncbi:ABC transporter ATP-binding protein/permease [Pseudomonas stutzeri]|uniref:ATP-binding cassette domain-containing protein n=1 Tax=Stutzerimonas stutzeri TaxID=316 RepID=UPI00210AD5AE|nr:ABC transporter ATP-binding protein [Stutzerimonas stutzeri]MCQ4291463.1 ABC transporter ATP-binding protein/permease [Stutzerimonas stutzeri]